MKFYLTYTTGKGNKAYVHKSGKWAVWNKLIHSKEDFQPKIYKTYGGAKRALKKLDETKNWEIKVIQN